MQREAVARAERLPVWRRVEMVQDAAAKAVQMALESCVRDAQEELVGKKRKAWSAVKDAAIPLSQAFKALTPEECQSFMRACPSVDGPSSEQLLRCCSANRDAPSARLKAFCFALHEFLAACEDGEAVDGRYRLGCEAVVTVVAVAGIVVGALAGGVVGAVSLPAYSLFAFLQGNDSFLGPHWVCDVVRGGACVAKTPGLEAAALVGAIIGAPTGSVWLAEKAHAWALKWFQPPDLSVVARRSERSGSAW